MLRMSWALAASLAVLIAVPAAASAERYVAGNVTTAEFIALAERKSGRDLTVFFNAWLYQPGKPQSW